MGHDRVRNIEGKLKREVKGLTICLHETYFLSLNYLDITAVAPGASICLYLGNHCPAAKLWAWWQISKWWRPPLAPPISQNRRGREQPGPHLTSGCIPMALFPAAAPHPICPGVEVSPPGGPRGPCLEPWGSCHPAAASQHQTEPSVTFPDTLAPIPPSRQAGDGVAR